MTFQGNYYDVQSNNGLDAKERKVMILPGVEDLAGLTEKR
jgi:hypothetical protein